jgi:hypothetical protein
MQLWILSDDECWRKMSADGILRASWKRVAPSWKPAYRWLLRRMAARGITRQRHPPVWAWHSCGRYERAPDDDTVFALESSRKSEGVLWKVEVPDVSALLSRYGPWNDLIDLLTIYPQGLASLLSASSALSTPLVSYDRVRSLIEEKHSEEVSAKELAAVVRTIEVALFDVSEAPGSAWAGNYRDIQACLPYLRAEWVVEQRRYHTDWEHLVISWGPADV